MHCDHKGSTAAHRLVSPDSEEAPALAGAAGFNGDETANSCDCAAKLIAAAAARAALPGIELNTLDDGAWLLRHARGVDTGNVRGVPALLAVVPRLEAARDDVRAPLQHMRGAS